jgi:hypothetical protein
MRIALLFVLLATGCSTTRESKEPDRLLHAYGDAWVYSKSEFNTEYLGLNSPHGIIGTRNAYRETHLVTNSAGKKISVAENLYALQRDGSLKKIVCCEYFREKGDLYDIDGKLVFIFDNARRYITDCFIHPAGKPENEFEPDRGNRIYGVTVFAEFDPKDDKFKASTFNAGDYPAEAYWAYERDKGYGKARMPITGNMAFLYSKRKAFMCDDPRAVPQKEER